MISTCYLLLKLEEKINRIAHCTSISGILGEGLYDFLPFSIFLKGGK